MRRILVVDDSGVLRDLAANYLTVFDTELRFAASGTEGWSAFLEQPPDLVLSDIEMPGMTGVELAQKIRAHGVRRIPVILMSSGQGDEGRAAVSRDEADLFLQKPLVAEVLQDAVARLLAVVPGEGGAAAGQRDARRTIRVVIADDTEVGRQLLGRLVELDQRFEVVGVASNGAEAVQLTTRLRPQLVLMDALMPVLDGISATRRIMRDAPTRVVIVTAQQEFHGATAALDATRAGALDLIAKPTWAAIQNGDARQALERLHELADVPVIRRWQSVVTPVRPRSIPPAGQVRVVAICASTGGPAVLARLLPRLKAAIEHVCVLIVQHVLPGFSPTLVQWLTETTGVTVELAQDGTAPTRGRVLLAPDGHHLAVESRDRLRVLDEPPIGAHRPSGTLLFETVAKVFAHEVIAVMLTGMGKDGVDGLRQVRANGGLVLTQSLDSCAVPGMPSAAIHSGVADLVLAPDQIAEEIVERATFHRSRTA